MEERLTCASHALGETWPASSSMTLARARRAARRVVPPGTRPALPNGRAPHLRLPRARRDMASVFFDDPRACEARGSARGVSGHATRLAEWKIASPAPPTRSERHGQRLLR